MLFSFFFFALHGLAIVFIMFFHFIPRLFLPRTFGLEETGVYRIWRSPAMCRGREGMRDRRVCVPSIRYDPGKADTGQIVINNLRSGSTALVKKKKKKRSLPHRSVHSPPWSFA